MHDAGTVRHWQPARWCCFHRAVYAWCSCLPQQPNMGEPPQHIWRRGSGMALLQARRCVGCGSRYWCLCLQLDPCTALLFCFSDTADTTAVAVVCFVLLLLPDAVCHTSATITCCPPPPSSGTLTRRQLAWTFRAWWMTLLLRQMAVWLCCMVRHYITHSHTCLHACVPIAHSVFLYACVYCCVSVCVYVYVCVI